MDDDGARLRVRGVRPVAGEVELDKSSTARFPAVSAISSSILSFAAEGAAAVVTVTDSCAEF